MIVAGVILCCFEAQGPPFTYMRVIRIIEPVCMDDEYTGPLNLPIVGDYIRKWGKPMPFLHLRDRDGGPSPYTRWTYSNPRSHWRYLWNWAT